MWGLDRPLDHSTEYTMTSSMIESYKNELRPATVAFTEK